MRAREWIEARAEINELVREARAEINELVREAREIERMLCGGAV
jgi:vacuolar-type H+-ATPase subunit E/Vma4